VIQQKRGWTMASLTGPVSIRSRRVHSPLTREWGPTARRENSNSRR